MKIKEWNLKRILVVIMVSICVLFLATNVYARLSSGGEGPGTVYNDESVSKNIIVQIIGANGTLLDSYEVGCTTYTASSPDEYIYVNEGRWLVNRDIATGEAAKYIIIKGPGMRIQRYWTQGTDQDRDWYRNNQNWDGGWEARWNEDHIENGRYNNYLMYWVSGYTNEGKIDTSKAAAEGYNSAYNYFAANAGLQSSFMVQQQTWENYSNALESQINIIIPTSSIKNQGYDKVSVWLTYGSKWWFDHRNGGAQANANHYNCLLGVKLDTIAPSVTANPSTDTNPTSTKSVKLTVSDTGSGLASGNIYQYYLSDSNTERTGGAWTTFTNGGTVSLTGVGTKYLWVKGVGAVHDNSGNVMPTTLVGTYEFPVNPPTIKVTPTSSDTGSVVNVKITADPGSGSFYTASDRHCYFLSTQVNPTVEGTLVDWCPLWGAGKNENTITIGTGLAGTYYLFVRAANTNLGQWSTGHSNGTDITINNIGYHRYGPYKFENPDVYLDLNGLLDGTSAGDITGFGTADVYVNGTCVANDVTDYCAKHAYGSTYEIKDIKASTGHTYNGIASGSPALSGTVGANRINVVLSFSTNTYTIEFNANGGTGTMADILCKYGEDYDAPWNTTFEKIGNTFLYWNTKSDGTGEVFYEGDAFGWLSSVQDDVITIFAIWQPNSYTITFDNKGGTGGPGSKTVTYGSWSSNNIAGERPTKVGYTFNGYATSTGTMVYDKNGLSVKGSYWTDTPSNSGTWKGTANLTVYAQWVANNYTITFDDKGGSGGPGSKTVTYGSNNNSNISSNIPTKTGHTFLGYYNNATVGSGTQIYTNSGIAKSGTRYWDSNSKWIENASITAYAQWTPTSYSVTYDYSTNGGTSWDGGTTTKTVSYNSAVDLSYSATKSGWTFVGWNTDKNATAKLSSYNMPANNIKLYAIYKKDITITFKDYYQNALSENASYLRTIYNTATTATVTAPTVRNGLNNWSSRGGWTSSTSANAAVAYNNGATISVTGNTTFYGLYQRTVTLSYNAQGGSSTPTTQTGTAYFNSAGNRKDYTFTLASAISKSGHTFDSWRLNSVTGTAYAAGSTYTTAVDVVMHASWLDSLAPHIVVTPDKSTNSDAVNDAVKSIDVTLQITETGSGLSTANKYEYGLSTSSSTVPTSWVTYVSGKPTASFSSTVSIGDGKDGTYYLWIKQVVDGAGNKSTSTVTTKTVSNSTYHVSGPYVFDNTAPTGTVKYTETSTTLGIGSGVISDEPYAIVSIPDAIDNIAGIKNIILTVSDSADSSNFKDYSFVKSNGVYSCEFNLYDSLADIAIIEKVRLQVKAVDNLGNTAYLPINDVDLGTHQNSEEVEPEEINLETGVDVNGNPYIDRDSFRIEAIISGKTGTNIFTRGQLATVEIYTYGNVQYLRVDFGSLCNYVDSRYDINPNLHKTAVSLGQYGVYKHELFIPLYCPESIFTDARVYGYKGAKVVTTPLYYEVSGTILDYLKTILKNGTY